MGIMEAVDQGQQVEESRRACLDLIIAIGARCHSDSQAFLQCELTHLNRSRRLVTLDLLDVTLDTVRILLLYAFYMLCACRRNTGYLYLGIAARVAHMLGLHHGIAFSSKFMDSGMRYGPACSYTSFPPRKLKQVCNVRFAKPFFG
jgi:hypothetical protein